jgi:glycosyltransferase involved in cell wall biosynthesis
MKKRIGMFLDTDFPPDPRVENEAITLSEAGFEVHLLSLSYKKGLPAREIWQGIHVHRVRCSRLTYKLSALAHTFPFYRWSIQPAIEAFIREVQPHFLHVHDMVMAEAVRRANHAFHLPLVLDLHENRPVIMQEYRHLKTFPGRWLIRQKSWEQAETRLINAATAVVTVTRAAALHYRSSPGIRQTRWISVPNTVRKNAFHQVEISREIADRWTDKFVLFYFGDTGIRRGLGTVLEAMPRLIPNVSNLHLVVVGTNSEQGQLEALAQGLGLENYISWEGWQPVHLLPSYVAASHVGLSPLKRNLHHDTTFANKIFQYMALGLPQVVSNCTAQAEVMGDTGCGMVFKAEDTDDLVRCILHLHSHAEVREQMKINGAKAFAEQWNWEKTSEELVGFYEGEK